MRKLRTRKEMEEYLSSHFRYYTMNNWNRSMSFARNIKIHNIDAPKEIKDTMYDMLDVNDIWSTSGIEDLIDDFDYKHDFKFQIGTNGRSGGYLVLYQGTREKDSHKSKCPNCGIRTWYEPGIKCTKCGEGTLVKYDGYNVFTFPGKSFPEDTDYKHYSIEELRWLINIVWDFDQTCEAIVQAFIEFCKCSKVVEKEVMVPKKVKVVEEV